MNRSDILDAVKQIICHDRQDTHGNPESTHDLIADYWNIYLNQAAVKNIGHCRLDASDVAVMMALFKIARHSVNPKHLDSLVDAIGYLAIAAELST